MRRRQALTLCGTALTSLAGCFDASQDNSGTVSAQFDALQPAVFELYVDAYELYTNSGSQYLFLTDLGAAGDTRRFRFDGSEYAPGVETSYDVRRGSAEFGAGTAGSGWVLFELPETGDASAAALVTEQGEWTPTDTLRDRLSAPLPTLDVTSFQATTSEMDRPMFTVTVHNSGNYRGRFVAILRRRSGLSPATGLIASRAIQSGSSETLTVTSDPLATPAPGNEMSEAIEYELVRPGGTETTVITGG